MYSEVAGEYGSKALYRMLGYFSIIGLLRVHVLLGDFTLALKVMENIELNQKVGPISLPAFLKLTLMLRHSSPVLLHATSRHITTSDSPIWRYADTRTRFEHLSQY